MPYPLSEALGRHAPLRPRLVIRPRLETVHLPTWVRNHLRVNAPLESPWIWRGLLVVTLLTIGGLCWLWIRRRRAGIVRPHRWLWRSLNGLGVLVLVMLTGLAYLNTYVGYLPTVSSLMTLATGGPSVPGAVPVSTLGTNGSRMIGPDNSAVVQITVGASRLDVPPLDAYVYLPPGYYAPDNAHRRYPVVYLLHGYPGRPADWMLAGAVPQITDELLAAHEIGPMIIVAPNADGGWLHDSECLNQVGGPQLASYLSQAVVKYVDAHFRTFATRSGRAVGGLSSGGYCAVNLGLRYSSVFSTIIAFEPYGDPGRSIIGSLLHGSTALYRENSPSYYLPTMTFRYPVAAFMDAGSVRSEIRRVKALATQLADRGQQVAFQVEPGQGHTWREALAGLPYGLVFAARHLLGGLATLPGHAVITNVGQPNQSSADRFARRASAQRCTVYTC